MRALFSAWLCVLLGLLPLEVRSVTLHSLSERHRLSLPRTSRFPKSSYTTDAMPTVSDLSVANDDIHIVSHGDRRVVWRSLIHKEHPPRSPGTLFLDQRDQKALMEATMLHRGSSRGRRHANGGGGGARGHGHLMRVGCVLGTCQVQNLSHRLYQLIGQSGREDSSPINPRSPHSYG